jgi:hypothetical protein
MANEITLTAGLAATKSYATISSGTLTKAVTMSGEDMVQNTWLAPTAGDEAIPFGEITGAPVACLIKNLDSTNYVELGLASGVLSPFAKILAGHIMLFGPGAASIYAKANSAAVRLQIWAVEA